jgi:DNA-binding transcriptional MocR family regulator
MIYVNLNRNNGIPLHKQLFTQLKELIHTGVLKPGTRMPSTRTFAERFNLSRSTVVRVYETLWADGYITSRPGSYSIIRKRRKILPSEPSSHQDSIIPWGKIASLRATHIHEKIQEMHGYTKMEKRDDIITMSKLSLDVRLFPDKKFRKCLSNVFLYKLDEIFNYKHSQGYAPLREFIAKRQQIHGISVTKNEILITNGAQSSIELALKLLTNPGSEAIIEAPTYFYVYPLFKFYGINLIPIPMKNTGMDLNYLQRVLKMRNPSFLYTIPNFHNPTSITSDQEHRERVLNLCEEYKIPILEDAFEEEMKYSGRVPFPIKSMDNNGIVIYLGSFSKVFFPGIRIGWMAADRECISRLTSLKCISDITTNLPAQAALYEFCKDGDYDKHIKTMHRIYRKRMKLAQKVLKENLKPFMNVSWKEPVGGYCFWLKVTDSGLDNDELSSIFLKNGVKVLIGDIFFENRLTNDQFIRLSISNLNEGEINEGIRRIAQTLYQIYKI